MTIKAFFERSKGFGIFLDEHNGNFKLNAGNRKSGNDNLDWVIIKEWNDDTKSYEYGESKRPMSIYLGDRESAKKALRFFLVQLGADEPGDLVHDESDENIPF